MRKQTECVFHFEDIDPKVIEKFLRDIYYEVQENEEKQNKLNTVIPEENE